jgi:hypothetical protein
MGADRAFMARPPMLSHTHTGDVGPHFPVVTERGVRPSPALLAFNRIEPT